MEDDVTRTIEEQLSAFLDGELPEEELQLLVRRLEREPSYRAKLARYSLAGSLLRNEPELPSTTGFRSRVMDDVATTDVAASDPDTEAVTAVPAAHKSRRRYATAAAILIGIAVLGVSQFTPVSDDVKIAAEVEAPAVVPAVRSAAAPVVRPRPAPASRGSRRNRINSDRFTSYMVSHGEFSRSFQGAMVDSRIFVQQASFEE